MSALLRCFQSALRPCRRPSGGGGWVGSPRSHCRDVEVEELLAPDHAGERLALHGARVRIVEIGLDLGVEGVRLGEALRDDLVEIRESGLFGSGRETKPHAHSAAGRDLEAIEGGRLGAGALRVHGARVAVDDVVVEAVLEVALGMRAVEPRRVGVVVGEQQRRLAVAEQTVVAEDLAAHADRGVVRGIEAQPPGPFAPGPGVAEPQLGQEVQRRRLGPAIDRPDLHQEVVRAAFGVLDEDVEIAIAVEHAGVDQLELLLILAAAAVLLDQRGVRERALRIFVEELQPAVGRRGIEVVVELLDVLAVVALAVGEAEQALLQDRIAAVPKRQREAEPLLLVGNAGDAVLAPAVGPRARLIVRKILPGVAVRAVVLADRAPLPLREIGSPVASRPRARPGPPAGAHARSARPRPPAACRPRTGARSAPWSGPLRACQALRRAA